MLSLSPLLRRLWQISINASCSLDEIMSARKEGQKVFFQVSSPACAHTGEAHHSWDMY